MKNLFSSIYLVSKISSALLTVLSIAIFTRLVSHDIFGQYLIGFAFAFITYSVVTQWLLGAHFGQQSRQHAAPIAGGAIILTGVSVMAGMAMIFIATLSGFIGADIALPTALLLFGLSAYFVANEVGRAQLLVMSVTSGAFLRSLGTLVLGSLALWQFGTAASLLIAVAIAHTIATLPIIVGLKRTIWTSGFVWPQRSIYKQLWRYGWPLIIAGGASALALYIDRLLLERYFGTEAVGPYGATLDFIKQSFVIVGETIAVSYVSSAKSLHGDNAREQAAPVLQHAFVTAAFLATFGIVFYVLLGDALFALVLDADYQEAVPLVPMLAFANALLILRAYYFAQTIYFSNSVRLELVSMLVALVVGSGAGIWLIPAYGITGAAMAFTAAQFAALMVFLGSRESRQTMPVDLGKFAKVVAAGVATIAIGEVVTHSLPTATAMVVNLTLIAAVSGWLLVRWNMFDAAHLWDGFGRSLGIAGRGGR
ncbi:MAG: lipopolysaccharide biosynthesis protein [Rhodobiaceae bacterium]|nr:lipopolysaccharide biosynthesis protein [Rhodobiaceae bacterium]